MHKLHFISTSQNKAKATATEKGPASYSRSPQSWHTLHRNNSLNTPNIQHEHAVYFITAHVQLEIPMAAERETGVFPYLSRCFPHLVPCFSFSSDTCIIPLSIALPFISFPPSTTDFCYQCFPSTTSSHALPFFYISTTSRPVVHFFPTFPSFVSFHCHLFVFFLFPKNEFHQNFNITH